jgi:anti-sigma B factor antagonist
VTPNRSEDLKIEILDSPRGARVLKLTGPLTLLTLFDFQEISRRATSQPVIVDISDMPYMDSAGLGSVISIFAHCQRTKRGFGIVGISERIRTLFQVTHCDGVLPCFDTIDSADAAVASK